MEEGVAFGPGHLCQHAHDVSAGVRGATVCGIEASIGGRGRGGGGGGGPRQLVYRVHIPEGPSGRLGLALTYR